MALLGTEPTSITQLMTNAKVSRKSIYEILNKLLDKELISYTIKDNKKQYNAMNPERLLEIQKEKQTRIEDRLPELLQKYKKDIKKYHI